MKTVNGWDCFILLFIALSVDSGHNPRRNPETGRSVQARTGEWGAGSQGHRTRPDQGD